MKTNALQKLALDPRFIPGVYNYCDRWCERCPLSNRCLNYAIEKAEDKDDPVERDLSKEKFWERIHRKFRETLEMVCEEAKARGIDLHDPKLQAKVKADERAERRLAAKNGTLSRLAMTYVKAVDTWFEKAQAAFKEKGLELETLARIEVGNPRAELAQLSEHVDVIRWYQPFIYVKLCRAIDSRASELLETDDEQKAFPRDSDGSAKVTLIAIDRSIAVWSGLRTALGGEEADGVLNLLAQLAVIRRETEKLFPQARAFLRPGFDERENIGARK